MGLEKGVSRTGTVFGIILGVFLSVLCTLMGFSFEYFNYFTNKYESEVTVCCTDSELEKSIINARKSLENNSETSPFQKRARLSKVERGIVDLMRTTEGKELAEKELQRIRGEYKDSDHTNIDLGWRHMPSPLEIGEDEEVEWEVIADGLPDEDDVVEWEVISDLEQFEIKHQPLLARIYKDKPTKLIAVYLPTIGVYLLLIIAPFLFGLYCFKGVARTLNWIIKGYRE